MLTYLKVTIKRYPQKNACSQWEFPHPHSPAHFPGGQRGLFCALEPGLYPGSLSGVTGLPGQGRLETRLNSWAVPQLAPLGMGNNLVDLPREPALARKPARTLMLKDQPTKVGLRPCQLMGRILLKPQQSLAREEQVRWVQFILHSHHVITTTLEGRNWKESLREAVLSSNRLLHYAEYKTAVYNLWSPSHLLSRCFEEAMLSATKVQFTSLLLCKRKYIL